jgi:hypothetical protein
MAEDRPVRVIKGNSPKDRSSGRHCRRWNDSLPGGQLNYKRKKKHNGRAIREYSRCTSRILRRCSQQLSQYCYTVSLCSQALSVALPVSRLPANSCRELGQRGIAGTWVAAVRRPELYLPSICPCSLHSHREQIIVPHSQSCRQHTLLQKGKPWERETQYTNTRRPSTQPNH